MADPGSGVGGFSEQEAGDEQHPALEPGDLNRRRGDAADHDRATEASAGRSAEPEPHGRHQRGADDEHGEPAHHGGLDAFEHVLVALDVPPETVIDMLGRLVDRSLVVVEDGSAGVLRYRLLESVRRFAADRLVESGLAVTAASAHADWYLENERWYAAAGGGDFAGENAAVLAAFRQAAGSPR